MKIFLIFVVMSFATAAHATTWYIRTDGGTATQCAGTTNAAYPGSGTAQACAYNHPYWLLNQSTWTWNVAANDTVQFGDAGPYYPGQGSNGHGLTWAHCAGDSADCAPPPFPDGVKFYGVNAGHCHNASHTGLTGPTQLIGINHLFKMWDFHGTNNVDFECFDITQLATCTSQGKTEITVTNTALTSGVATYTWTYPGSDQHLTNGESITVTGSTNGGGVFNVVGAIITSITNPNGSSGTFTVAIAHADVASAADTGTTYYAGWCDTPAGQSGDYLGTGLMFSYLTQQGPSNLILKDVAVHGLKSTGILGSKLNTSPTDTITISDVYLDGNGSSGWNTDGGGCGSTCKSQGTINASYITANWNGCAEVHPNGGVIGGNGFNYCVDQAYAGYGDALTMISTGGTWNWTHITANYNTQDGIDSLHVGDDATVRPTTTMQYIFAMGNEGQSIKGGGGQMTLRNAIGIANCDVFANAANFPLNPSGWNALTQLRCRANDAMAFAMTDGDVLNVQYVTNIVQQNVAFDMSTANCTTNCVVHFANITTLGYISPYYHTYPGIFYYGGPNPFANPSSTISNNAYYHMGSSGTSCPGDSHETNYVCTDPLFVSESNINAMDVHLSLGSALIGAGVAIAGVTTDFSGQTRPDPPSIGAYEYSGPPPPPGLFSGSIHLSGAVQFH